MHILPKILFAKTSSVSLQWLRYLVVGGLAFVADFACMVVLKEWGGLSYLIAATLSFCVGLCVNYLLSVLWVFDVRAVKNAWKELSMFTGIGIFSLGLNVLVMYICTGIFGVDYRISKIAATGITFNANFFLRRMLLFTKKHGATC